jgi:poly-gamma-glutamate synthesis protein (capsule biosynthesis protein)
VTKAQWTPATISSGVPVPLTGNAADAAREAWRHLRGCTDLSGHPPG